MNVEFHPKFNKDVDAIKAAHVKLAIEQIIISAESAASLAEIPNLVKLKGSTNAFRIRSGTYRIGLYVQDETLVFSRVMHRRNIYRHFP